MKFQALAFDLDGTLVDSNIDFTAIRREVGLQDKEPILEAIAQRPVKDQSALLEIVHRFEKKGAEESSPVEGAIEFVYAARERRIPCAIFTRNSRETAAWSLREHKIPYDLLIAREDAKPKPEPDGLWQIAREFAVAPAELLFVGDYRFDLEAGLRAGVPTALYLPESADFPTDGAHFSFLTFAELTGWFFA